MSINLLETKRRVRERDNHTCQKCGLHQKEPLLIVHHLDKNRYNNIMSNLITVCNHCHGILHTGEKRIRPKKINETTYSVIIDHQGKITIPRPLLDTLGIDYKECSNAAFLVEAYPNLEKCTCLIVKKGIT